MVCVFPIHVERVGSCYVEETGRKYQKDACLLNVIN